MDYQISGKSPDIAQAVVNHTQNADGTVSPQGAGNPLPVAGPLTLRATAVPTITSGSAYAAGNAVGGLLTFAGLARNGGQGGVLQAAFLKDKAGQNVSYDLFLFDSAPTAPTDKTAVALSATDLGRCIGVVSFSGASLGAASTMAVLTASGLGLAYKLGSGTTVYGILVTRGTPTYASTSDVSVDLVALPD